MRSCVRTRVIPRVRASEDANVRECLHVRALVCLCVRLRMRAGVRAGVRACASERMRMCLCVTVNNCYL